MECKRIYFPCANLLALWGKGVINKDLLFLRCAGERGVCTGVEWDDGMSLANAVLVPRDPPISSWFHAPRASFPPGCHSA